MDNSTLPPLWRPLSLHDVSECATVTFHGVLLRCALSPATLALRYGIPYRSKCILPNLPFMELIIKALNWLLEPKMGGLQVFRERGRIGREGVRMGGDRKDSNPFLAKRPTPVSSGGGVG